MELLEIIKYKTYKLSMCLIIAHIVFKRKREVTYNYTHSYYRGLGRQAVASFKPQALYPM
jgi:hypothetical protein